MGSTIDANTALLTEHLRYTPISLIDDIINSINTLSYKAIEAVERGLLSATPQSLGIKLSNDENEAAAQEENLKHEIENGVHQLETLLEATIDKNFDKMEVFALRSIIAIPEDLGNWIRLKHYEGLNFNISPDTPTIESIMLQRRKFQESQRLHRLLSAEVRQNAQLITHLKSLISQQSQLSETRSDGDATSQPYPVFGFLSDKGGLVDGSGDTPLSTTTSFALSQLPSLKALLAELRPQMEALSAEKSKADPNLVEEKEPKSWRRERLEYIETQTRRHLEQVAGLELGKNGEVVDGEWQGEGRKLAKGEVEDLERVIALVGGRKDEEMDEAP